MFSSIRFVAAVAGMTVASSVLAQGVLRQGESRDWTIRFRVNIRAWQDFGSVEQQRGASRDNWEFEQATVVVPVLNRTSMHRVHENRVDMKVRVNDRDAIPASTDPFRRLDNEHAGSRYLGFAIAGGTARDIEVVTEIGITSYDVRVDDDRAIAVEWPSGDWPEDALSALDPQVGIELGLDGEEYRGLDRVAGSMDNVIKRLGTDPKNVPPYLVAKYLTGAVWAHVRSRSGDGLNTARTGEIEGIEVNGVPTTFSRRRGNQFDTCALLVYAMRRAGLPARMVIGIIADARADDEDVLTQRNDREGEMIAWVEFALVENGRTTWIPVDLNGMMSSSSRAPDISDIDVLRKPWDGFGTIDDTRYWAPFAHHVHPPLTVKAYNSPGFWGIFATPAEPSRAEQMILFDVTSTAKTAESSREDREQDSNNTPRRRRR